MMATTLRCAVLDDYQDAALGAADWSSLDSTVAIERFERHIEGEDALAAALASFEIIVAMRERTLFSRSLLARLPSLRLLVTTGMVNASIDLAAARDLGILVSGTRGSVGPAAELAWGLLLALRRNLADEFANFRQGGEAWQLSVGSDLMGTTLGVVGLGKLGKRMVDYGKAFGMDVVGWSKNNTPDRSAALGIDYAASLDELLARSDTVTLHLTLNDETRGLIGASQLDRMKNDAVLINTSRGPLIDEAALLLALQEKRIGGAGLDVFNTEPLPADHPFRTLPNVVATPHLGYVTRQTYAIYYADAVQNILSWTEGTPVRVLNC